MKIELNLRTNKFQKNKRSCPYLNQNSPLGLSGNIFLLKPLISPIFYCIDDKDKIAIFNKFSDQIIIYPRFSLFI
ncbi:hypothetical protein BpHYR1_032017 [Brachionus plicatilis]|uniref:Uncharacterized protein n=1 Tax=Brachionus plicatilis TaxID=10195 RepID=A0A3M7T239_BRAPC|nr:hypothetical protein BpHYR1_032017 [Brachionus plicatilis]